MSQKFTSKQYFTQMNTIYFSQAASMMLFAGVGLLLWFKGQIAASTDEDFSKLLTYILIALVIVGAVAAQFLFTLMLSRIDKNLDFKKRTPKYVAALLVRGACLQLPGLFAGVVFFLTGNLYVLLIPMFIAALFYVLRPTPSSIADDLKLSEKERAMINNPEAIVVERD